MPERAAPALRAPSGYVSPVARGLLGDPDLDIAKLPLAERLALARVRTEQTQALVRLASARLDTAYVLAPYRRGHPKHGPSNSGSYEILRKIDMGLGQNAFLRGGTYIGGLIKRCRK